MVETRSQFRRRQLWESMENDNLPEEEECTACEQRQGSSMYGDNDSCKRHRKRDDQPYGVEVTSYRRRKPIRS